MRASASRPLFGRPWWLEPLPGLAVLILLTLALGAFGLVCAHAATGTIVAPPVLLAETIELTIGHLPDSLAFGSPVAALGLARLLLPLLAIVLLATVLWRLVRNPVRLWLASHRSGHLVIAGDPLIAAPIVWGERRIGSSAVVLSTTPHPKWVAQAADLGAPHVSPAGPEDLGRYLHKARLVVLSDQDDAVNVDLALRLAADGAGGGRPLPLPVLVRVDDLARREGHERRLAAAAAPEDMQFRLMSLPALIARTLVRNTVIDRVTRLGSSHRVVVIAGYTPVMAHYLIALLTGGHFRDGRPLRLIVVDPQAQRCRNAFYATWPGAATLSAIRFETGAPADPAVAAWIADQLPEAVVFDGADETACREAAEQVDAVFRQRDQPPPAYALHGTGETVPLAAPTVIYGGATIAAHAALAMEERHEYLARAIHDFYLEGRLDEGERIGSRAAVNDWDHLPESIRDHNRLVVDLYELKLRGVGARIVAGSRGAIVFEPDELEDLARAEHDCWMAVRIVEGWQHGTTRDEAARQHPDLLPHGDLSPEARERDREQVRIITRLLGRTGRHAVRDLRVLVGPHQHADLTQALARVHADYPDRAVVLIGDPTDAGTRAVLLTAHARGMPIELVTDGHPARWAGDDRLRDLIQSADRIIVPAPGATPADTLAARAHIRLEALS